MTPIPVRRRIATATAVAALLAVPATVASAPAASAAPYPPGTGPLVLSSTTVSAGGSLTFTGSGFTANEAVGARLAEQLRGAPGWSDPTLLAVVRANGSGVASGTVTVPRRVPSGSYSFSLAGSASGQYLSAIITVTRVPGRPGHPGHPGFPGFPPGFPFSGFSGHPHTATAVSAPVNIDTAPVASRFSEPESRPGRSLAAAGAAAALGLFGCGAYLMRRRRRG